MPHTPPPFHNSQHTTQGEQDNTKCRTNPRTGHHNTPPLPPFNKGHLANKTGDANIRWEGRLHTTALPSLHHPPFAMPPHRPRCPHPPPRRGGYGQRIPHRTNNTDTHTTCTTSPGNEHHTTRRQYSRVLHWDERGTGHTRRTMRTGSSTHHRHSTAAHTEERRTPSTHPLTLFTFTQSTNDHDQR